jgi:aryl-alcohol dehydrogenase-like predicted oxidoreductase
VELGYHVLGHGDRLSGGSSEEFGGRAIKLYARREEIMVATKVSGKMHDGLGGSGLPRVAIMEQVDASLRRSTLTASISTDLPLRPDTSVEETMETLHDVVSGKVHYLGE